VTETLVRAETTMKDGLLLVDKEPGLTSHDVVQKARRITRQKKAGHCGTLDPNATGLLLLTLGKATRLTRFLISAPKVYEGVILLGRTTDTYDTTGETVDEGSTEGVTREAVAGAMAGLVGTIEHAVPPYSAKKVQGRKLYELARAGEEVPRETKEVTVYEFEPQGDLSDDRIGFRLACASGTYARTLAHEVGLALGCGATLEALRRVQVGPFDLGDAITLGELTDHLDADGDSDGNGEGSPAAWIPFDRIPLPFPQVVADHRDEERVKHGQTLLVRDLEGDEGDWIKIMNRRDELIAVGAVTETIGERGVGIVQPKVVFK
jgi:tRNA pseudouridine55 synthase